jgi:hypothetical protein
MVDRADVWMIEGRSRSSLALESTQTLRIVCNILGEKLEGDEKVEADVLCFVHDTHPAASQLSRMR